eukprot:TRINITY_DN2148_c0_g1_i5.p1 TRINITY_DN2148_c0_g1~~TRINITY_DN2148_c0_g1_i5.p1  ORF type:complete len:639 (+),score=86.01 TRINITY_DN2148_c0_g1_i5:150-2066(+)
MLNANKLVKNYVFNVNEPIGKGKYSTVYLAQNTEDRNLYALKVMPLAEIRQNMEYSEIIENEIKVLSYLQEVTSPYLVHLIEWFRTEKFLYVVMEYCDGGDFEKILATKNGPVPESRVIQLLSQFVLGYQQIHQKKIMHRDLKLSNLMLHQDRLKISDFGFSKLVEKLQNPMVHSIKGTPLTMAPQVFRGDEYSEKCDVWSLGVLLYQLLFFTSPWDSTDGMSNYFQRVMNDPVRFNRSTQVSDAMKDFIVRCLQIDEGARWSWEEIFDHPILQHNRMLRRSVTSEQNDSTVDANLASQGYFDNAIDLPSTPKGPQSSASAKPSAVSASAQGKERQKSPFQHRKIKPSHATDIKQKSHSRHPLEEERTRPPVSITNLDDLRRMLDDYQIVKDKILHNHKSNIIHIHNICTLFGKASYMLSLNEGILKQNNLWKGSKLLDMFMSVMNLSLVSRFMQLIKENEGLFDAKEYDDKQIIHLIETMQLNEEAYFTNFFNLLAGVILPNSDELIDNSEIKRYVDGLEHIVMNSKESFRSMIPSKNLFLFYVLPFLEGMFRSISNENLSAKETKDILLTIDYLLDSIVLHGLMKDILNGSYLPFLQGVLVQATKSKEIVSSLDSEYALKAITIKKEQILSKLNTK